MNKIQRALISLTDKSGIEQFAAELARMGIEILSTGGTAQKIRTAGIAGSISPPLRGGRRSRAPSPGECR